jgi:hypothetical protein
MLPVRLTEVVLHTPGSRPLRVLEVYVFHSLHVPQPKLCMLLGPGTSGDGNAAEQSATTRRQDTASFMSVAWRVNSGKHQQNRACNRPFSRGGGAPAQVGGRILTSHSASEMQDMARGLPIEMSQSALATELYALAEDYSILSSPLEGAVKPCAEGGRASSAALAGAMGWGSGIPMMRDRDCARTSASQSHR